MSNTRRNRYKWLFERDGQTDHGIEHNNVLYSSPAGHRLAKRLNTKTARYAQKALIRQELQQDLDLQRQLLQDYVDDYMNNITEQMKLVKLLDFDGMILMFATSGNRRPVAACMR